MNVWVVTDRDGNVVGVYTKQRKALASMASNEREYGKVYILSEVTVNEESFNESPDET